MLQIFIVTQKGDMTNDLYPWMTFTLHSVISSDIKRSYILESSTAQILHLGKCGVGGFEYAAFQPSRAR